MVEGRRFGGWFVAMPIGGECDVCGCAWSDHGRRCHFTEEDAWSLKSDGTAEVAYRAFSGRSMEWAGGGVPVASVAEDDEKMRPWPSWKETSRTE